MDPLQFILLSVMIAVLISVFFSAKRKKCTAPQAAGAWPIIGHMHLFGSSQLTHKTLGSMADNSGPIFTINQASHTILIVSSPEIAKECFTVHDKIFADRPVITASKLLGYDNAMFGFCQYGSYWRELRKIATVELLSNQRINMLRDIRAEEADITLREIYAAWEEKGKPENGVTVDMKQKFGDLTANIVLRMIGGKRLFGESGDSDKEEARKCSRIMRDSMYLFGVFVLSDAIPFLGWLDFHGHEKAMKKTAKELDKILEGWLEEHKLEWFFGQKEKEKHDFMDVMLRILDGADIFAYSADTVNKATCLLLMLAGSDTTMITLTWALSLLLNHPHVLEKVRYELDAKIGDNRDVDESDINDLIYLQAVVKETLRLYPPGPLIMRSTIEDCTLSSGNCYIPAGTHSMVNVWKIQRDPSIWPDPEQFIPERFLTTHKEVDVQGQSFVFLPFGSGRRSCPGVSLAFQIVHYALAKVLHSFIVSKPSMEDVDMTESPGLTNLKATPLEAECVSITQKENHEDRYLWAVGNASHFQFQNYVEYHPKPKASNP